jgi:hypothetical protein
LHKLTGNFLKDILYVEIIVKQTLSQIWHFYYGYNIKLYSENRARNSPRDDQHPPPKEKNAELEIEKSRKIRKGLYISRKHF